MPRPKSNSRTSKSHLRDAIQLSNLQRSAPPSYESQVNDPSNGEKAKKAEKAEKTVRALQRKPNDPEANAEQPAPITPAQILFDYVIARRREGDAPRDRVDLLLDWFNTAVRAFTVAGVVFCVVWAAYKWWSLGPHYAPVKPVGEVGS